MDKLCPFRMIGTSIISHATCLGADCACWNEMFATCGFIVLGTVQMGPYLMYLTRDGATFSEQAASLQSPSDLEGLV